MNWHIYHGQIQSATRVFGWLDGYTALVAQVHDTSETKGERQVCWTKDSLGTLGGSNSQLLLKKCVGND